MYYWTTTEDRGNEFTVKDGGYYEALDRHGDGEIRRGKLKSNGTIIPSSDVPEMCVSNTPQASLFAKIHGSNVSKKYYIYETNETPDVDVSNALSLDFEVIEEFRYNMNKNEEVSFSRSFTVDVPQRAIELVELCYQSGGKNEVDSATAEAVKKDLQRLIQSGRFTPENYRKSQAKKFREYADAYGIEQAKRLFGGTPENIDSENFSS